MKNMSRLSSRASKKNMLNNMYKISAHGKKIAAHQKSAHARGTYTKDARCVVLKQLLIFYI